MSFRIKQIWFSDRPFDVHDVDSVSFMSCDEPAPEKGFFCYPAHTSGEAGIGKTTLVEAAKGWMKDLDPIVLMGRCLPGIASPFFIFFDFSLVLHFATSFYIIIGI